MENNEFWEMYWESRLQDLQNQGKKEAILTVSRIIQQLSRSVQRPLRLLELGSGTGQIIGALVDGHARVCSASSSVGVDYLHASVQAARRAYPWVTFIEGDFTDAGLLEKLGQFDIVILVNALHEVFSATYSVALQSVDVPAAKQRVANAFSLAAGCVAPGGHLVLFDGLEPPGDPQRRVRLRFLSPQSLQNFKTFAHEYHPFQVSYQVMGSPHVVEMAQRDFTRYITKSIFLGKALWKRERLESYQYFTEEEFRAVFASSGLEIQTLRTLTVDEEKWRRTVVIETPGIPFPEEHILIVGRKLP